jgi:hypothetical protein
MNRREFVTTAAAAPLTAAALNAASNAETVKPGYIELRKFQLRNTTDNQRARLTEFVSKTYAPGLTKAGAGPIGLFTPVIAPEAPFLLLLAAYSSLDLFDAAHESLGIDASFVAEAEKALGGKRLFERMEVALLRGFPGFPKVVPPASEEGRPARLFELRMYESESPLSLKKKIGMFESGEIDIFRKYGLLPVFFGEQIAGDRMPNLTYMVAFDNIAAREANWKAFGGSPEWKKLSSTPGLSDGETVTNISNMLLAPAAGSQIR